MVHVTSQVHPDQQWWGRVELILLLQQGEKVWKTGDLLNGLELSGAKQCSENLSVPNPAIPEAVLSLQKAR